jgi:hypothetical protein
LSFVYMLAAVFSGVGLFCTYLAAIVVAIFWLVPG